MNDAERGTRIVWVMGKGRSCVHRAFQAGFTFCSRRIPAERLDPNSRDAKCGRCETLYQRAERYRREDEKRRFRGAVEKSA